MYDLEIIFDNYVIIFRSYDKYGRVEIVQYRFDRDSVLIFKIGYDEYNRIYRWERNVNGDEIKYLYFYDKDSNIEEVYINGVFVWRFSYSNNGNVKRLIRNGEFVDLEYDFGDRISKLGNKNYKFDEDGFMVKR